MHMHMHSVLIENHRSTQRANLQLHPRVFDPLNIFLWTMNANNMHTECLELVTPDRDKAAQSSNPEIRQQNANALSPTKLATLQGPSREMALHALYSSTSLLFGERKLDWERQATSNTNSGQKAITIQKSSITFCRNDTATLDMHFFPPTKNQKTSETKFERDEYEWWWKLNRQMNESLARLEFMWNEHKKGRCELMLEKARKTPVPSRLDQSCEMKSDSGTGLFFNVFPASFRKRNIKCKDGRSTKSWCSSSSSGMSHWTTLAVTLFLAIVYGTLLVLLLHRPPYRRLQW